ncbi:MAG: MPT63 family protein [Mycobacteriaceae bacterium]|nr:MPT63 family protein [Mycobacteriaceae bacterium]
MRNIVKVMAAAAAMVLLAGTGIPAAFAAAKCPHMFGSQQRVADAGGAVVQEWIATDLQRSADLLPGYSAVSKPWEAGVSVSAMKGAGTPIIPNFQAVSRSGVR